MILHIVIDDKFIDMAYDIFEEAAPGENKFIIVSNRNKSFNYIKRAKVDRISTLEFLSKKFANSLLEYDFVVLHWLDDYKKKLVLNAPEGVKFLWIGWGGDYYCYINNELLLPETKELFNLLNNLNKNKEKDIINLAKSTIINMVFLRKTNNTDKVLEKINYFAPVLKEDYALVKESFKNFKPQYISWNYGTLEKHLIKFVDLKISGNNILIGNSATYENNHIEAFKSISKLELKNRKIIAPLSYGDGLYSTKVIEMGYKMFRDNFIPLTNFMPIESYNEIISSCSIVIMNHLRQQALGNIVIMMYLGAKVYLRKENPVYHFFKKQGAYIYSIDELNSGELDMPLSDNEINCNREILKKHWSNESILNRTKNLIEKIKNDHRIFP